jgi:hypothetical protein
MEPKYYLYLAQAVSTVAWILIVQDFLVPRSRGNRPRLLQSLLLLHAFRFVGLGMFIPGMPLTIPPEFAIPAAWGDYVASILALVAYSLLKKNQTAGTIATWVFTVWGIADLGVVFYQAFALQVANHMGVMFWIFAAYAPSLVVSHIVILRVLMRPARHRAAAVAS